MALIVNGNTVANTDTITFNSTRVGRICACDTVNNTCCLVWPNDLSFYVCKGACSCWAYDGFHQWEQGAAYCCNSFANRVYTVSSWPYGDGGVYLPWTDSCWRSAVSPGRVAWCYNASTDSVCFYGLAGISPQISDTGDTVYFGCFNGERTNGFNACVMYYVDDTRFCFPYNNKLICPIILDANRDECIINDEVLCFNWDAVETCRATIPTQYIESGNSCGNTCMYTDFAAHMASVNAVNWRANVPLNCFCNISDTAKETLRAGWHCSTWADSDGWPCIVPTFALSLPNGFRGYSTVESNSRNDSFMFNDCYCLREGPDGVFRC